MAWESASVLINLGDKKLSKQYLERVGRECVQIILKRTAKGLDAKGKPFIEYSDAYKKSDDFKLTRKNPGLVDLRLSGDMLADLTVISARDGRILIGFEDELQRAKAHGHITGKKYSGFPIRDFLGISQDELAQALRKIPPPKELKKAFIEARKDLLWDDDDVFDFEDVISLAELTAEEAEIL